MFPFDINAVAGTMWRGGFGLAELDGLEPTRSWRLLLHKNLRIVRDEATHDLGVRIRDMGRG